MLIFFAHQYITKDYFSQARKCEIKKQEQKIINKPTNKNCKKDQVSIIEIFLNMRKLKKEIMLAVKIKICQTQIEKEEKNISKII